MATGSVDVDKWKYHRKALKKGAKIFVGCFGAIGIGGIYAVPYILDMLAMGAVGSSAADVSWGGVIFVVVFFILFALACAVSGTSVMSFVKLGDLLDLPGRLERAHERVLFILSVSPDAGDHRHDALAHPSKVVLSLFEGHYSLFVAGAEGAAFSVAEGIYEDEAIRWSEAIAEHLGVAVDSN